MRAFQFLIGRLKTAHRRTQVLIRKKVSIPHRQAKNFDQEMRYAYDIKFQFLIGRLKTLRAISCIVHICAFQFLIGRLKTERAASLLQGVEPGFNSS